MSPKRQPADVARDEPPTSLRLSRELLSRADRLKGTLGETRADVLRAAVAQGLFALEEQAAVGRAAIARVALDAATRVLGVSARALAREVTAAVEARDVPGCVRCWPLVKRAIEAGLKDKPDEDLRLFESEVVRGSLGAVSAIAGRPGWAAQIVGELMGEERQRVLWR